LSIQVSREADDLRGIDMDPFVAKLLLGGIVGGAVVCTTTIAGERFGSKIGGFVGGLPFLVMIIYFFIGWAQGIDQAHAATASFPLTYTIMVFCVFVYVLQKWESLVLSVLSFVTLWITLQTIVVLLDFRSYGAALMIWAAFLMTILLYLRGNGAAIIARSAAAKPQRMSVGTRAVIGSSIIMAAVYLSKVGGPVVGSVFAAFPGVFLSTLIIAHRNVGVDFSRSLLAPMMMSGMINCIVYVAVFRFLLFDLGLIGATLAAMGAVVFSGYASRRLIDILCSMPAPTIKPA
jgi:uncharacterized membrane protein (GlpM family)